MPIVGLLSAMGSSGSELRALAQEDDRHYGTGIDAALSSDRCRCLRRCRM